MTIILAIENIDQLADGGPVRFQADGRGFEIGRERHLDWTLPDPSRFISGRHCEVRYENGGYYLYDVSRNGTFVNGAPARMKSPHRLESGDRLQIGPYLVSVAVQAQAAESGGDYGYAPAPQQGGFGSIWDTGAPAPPPVDRREFVRPEAKGHRAPDIAEQFLELPGIQAPPPLPVPPPFGAPAPGSPAGGRSPFGPAPVQSESPFGAPPAVPPRPPLAQALPGGVAEGFIQPVVRGQPVPAAPVAPVVAAPVPAAPPVQGRSGGDFLAAFAAGAQVSPAGLAGRDPQELAYEIGVVFHLVVRQMSGLLKARAAAKAITKSGKRTTLQANGNNPLKFIPTPEEIIEVMLAGRRGYLDARGSFEEAFDDLESHEIATFSAMQKALSRLLDGIAPQTIEGKVAGSAFSSKKARAWEDYVERWEAMSDAGEHGVLNVFLTHFAEAYDEATRKKK